MDPQLLAVFDEIYKTRSVSLAADNLGMPPAAVNIALGRLRRLQGDPLFIRTSRGLRPTQHAAGLIGPIRQSLGPPTAGTPWPALFDPSRCGRTLRISMSDIGRLALLPALTGRLFAAAPSLKVEIDPVSAATPQRLEAGQIDLAVGFLPGLDARFHQHRLFDEDYVCVMRRSHPRVGAQLTTELFERERHVVVTAGGSGSEQVERELDRLGVRHDIALRLPGFLGLGALVAGTDLLLTAPQRLARMLERSADVKWLAPPFGLPVLPIGQHWHERQHDDAGGRWLRSMLFDLLPA